MLRQNTIHVQIQNISTMASIAQASEKPSKPSRLRQAREHLPTFLRPSKQKARASAQSDVQEHEDPPASGDLNLNLAKAEDPVDKPNQSLWDRAAGELGDECKYVRTCFTTQRI